MNKEPPKKAAQLVIEAIRHLRSHKGFSVREILNYIGDSYNVNSKIFRCILTALRRGKDCGVLNERRGKYTLKMAATRPLLMEQEDGDGSGKEDCGKRPGRGHGRSRRRSSRRRSSRRRSGKRKSLCKPRGSSRRRRSRRRSKRRTRSRRRGGKRGCGSSRKRGGRKSFRRRGGRRKRSRRSRSRRRAKCRC